MIEFAFKYFQNTLPKMKPFLHPILLCFDFLHFVLNQPPNQTLCKYYSNFKILRIV